MREQKDYFKTTKKLGRLYPYILYHIDCILEHLVQNSKIKMNKLDKMCTSHNLSKHLTD